MSPTISVVVPVYNSADTLPELMRRLDITLSPLGLLEVILINDGSQDNSWEVISELASQWQVMHGINLMRNYGQHNALLCGIRMARGEVVVTLDDDLQNPPEEIPKLLAPLTQGYDVIYGPPEYEQHSVWRVMASYITKVVLQNAMGSTTARDVSAFRVFRAELRDAFAHYEGPYVSIDVLLTWATTRFASVKVHQDERRVGKSNYTIRKLLTHALNMMTGFSTLPLQLASLIGFVFTVFGMVVFAYVFGRFLIQGSPVAGFPFLASIIAIFSGAQLFALGIIGEYLARMHFRMMGRPTYTMRERMGGKAQ